MGDARTSPKGLIEVYHDWIGSTVDEKGFEIPHGLVVAPDGSMTVVALAVPPVQAHRVMIAQWLQEPPPVEMIYAIDRFTRPGQGTTLRDVMAGFHVVRPAAPRPFIIEYQFEPRIVKPICWDNLFWNAALLDEINTVLRQQVGI